MFKTNFVSLVSISFALKIQANYNKFHKPIKATEAHYPLIMINRFILKNKHALIPWFSIGFVQVLFVFLSLLVALVCLLAYRLQGNIDELEKLRKNKVVNGAVEIFKNCYWPVKKMGYSWVTFIGFIEDDLNANKILIFPWPATKILSDEPQLKVMSSNFISVRAAHGEFAAVSFVLRAPHRDFSNIVIQPTNMAATDGAVIPASHMDIRVVKQWYQSGEADLGKTSNKYLLSELLLKDDGLVKVDAKTQTNSLRVTLPNGQQAYVDVTAADAVFPSDISVYDAKTLLPFKVIAHHNKQIWLTIHVPESAKPGLYIGILDIRDADGHVGTVSLGLTVLPFTLSQPRLEYSIYYTSTLSKDGKPGFNSKSSAQILAELANMRDHGIKYPSVYEDLENLEIFLALIKVAGLPKDHVYVLGTSGLSLDPSPAAVENFKNVAASFIDIAAKSSFANVYFYAHDEATLATLAQQRPFLILIHQAGGKVVTAMGGDGSGTAYVEAADGQIDAPVLAGKTTNLADIAAWHSHGANRVFMYANPQVGVENPAIYRKNFGLGLFIAGYDGAMDFAYQYPFGAAWNDFDNPKQNFRDHMFTYPTSDGIIDTIQWEGFREGVDDTRYLATLLDIDPNRTEAGMRTWISSLYDKGMDSDSIRELLIDEILKVLANKTVAVNAARQ